MPGIDFERRGHIATVTIDNPEARNAINFDMWGELEETFRQQCADKRVRAIVLRGAGNRAFSSGADISEFQAFIDGTRSPNEYWEVLDHANSAVESCSKPVIAMVTGPALGAGCALAASCDLRIAHSRALWGVPAAKIGLNLGINDTRRIREAVGTHARWVLLTARILSADEGLRMGFFDTVVAPEKLEEETYRLAKEIAGENAPLAMLEAKSNLRVVKENPGLAGIHLRSHPIGWAKSYDLQEGVSAYKEKRRPKFRGR